MHYQELPVALQAGPHRLLGIVTRPDTPASTGVVVVVGGPQYRVGSHRQFVQLARTLAQAGYAVLRFDVCGMGDSEGQPQDFQHTDADIAAAIQALQQAVPAVREVALWGLCDGASAALLYCQATGDARVRTLCLANPWVRSADSLARLQLRHYYGQRLRSAGFWRRLLRLQIGFAALRALVQTVGRVLHSSHSDPPQASIATSATFADRMAQGLAAFPGHVLLLLSAHDYVAQEFIQHTARSPAWRKALQHPRLHRHTLAGADHTFSSAALRAEVATLTLRHGLRQAPAANPMRSPQAGGSCTRGRPPTAT